MNSVLQWRYDTASKPRSLPRRRPSNPTNPNRPQAARQTPANQSPCSRYQLRRKRSEAGFGQDDARGTSRALLPDAAVAVDPGRKARIGGDQKRLAALHRAEHAADQVHVQFAGAPEPAVVGEIHEDVGLAALGGQPVDLAANHLRQHALVADVRREADAVEIEGGRPLARRGADGSGVSRCSQGKQFANGTYSPNITRCILS